MGIGDGGAAICVAPVKGATQGVSADILLHIKFQSALPAKRATSRTPRNPVCSSNFNPRSREGSDVDAVAAVKLVEKISIHAPAKGATAKITKTIPNDFYKINNYNNSFA
jgi:hypothetical protein